MRKLTSFLALLVIAFALPDKAKAWDYSGGSDPWKIVLKLDGYDSSEMRFENNGWHSEIFTAKSSDIRFQTDLYYGDRDQNNSFSVGNNDYTVYANGNWHQAVDYGDGWYNLSGLTTGIKYRLDIEDWDGNGNEIQFRVVEIPVETIYLYTFGSNGKEVECIGSANNDNGKFTFHNDLNQGTYLFLSRNANAETWDTMAADYGRFNPDDNDVELPASNTAFVSNKSNGSWKISNDGRYTITVDWANRTLSAVNDLYIYTFGKDGKEVECLGSASNVGGNYTFHLDLNQGTFLFLSSNPGAETWDVLQANGGRFNPDGKDIALPANNTAFTDSNNGSWYAPNAGRYIVTVNWPNRTLSAVNNLYIYSSENDWTTQRGMATPNLYGIYNFTVDLKAGEYIALSENDKDTFHSWEEKWTPKDETGNDKEIKQNEITKFGYYHDGAWYATKPGKYSIKVDWRDRTFKAFTVNVHMPLSSTDFTDNRKHYFLVGERTGEWHLQPEWELREENGALVLNNRFFYNGAFAIGVVDNYNDYIQHKFTYYCSNLMFTSDTWSSTGDISGTGRVYDSAKGSTRYNPSDVFYAAFDGEDGYFTGRGKFMSEIKVSLNGDRLPTGITFTKGSDEEASRQRVFTLVGNNIINQNFNNESGTGNTTMHNRGYDGWFDSWIQYDQGTNKPYVDGNGEYLYHTSFTPDYLAASPVQFNLRLADGNEFAYTSNNIKFVEWNNLPNLDSDPYRDFYQNAFSGLQTISNDMGIRAGEGYNFNVNVECTTDTEDNRTTTPTANWNCYVVRDMWIGGDIKFWSGWGGNEDATNGGQGHLAVWHGPNGGPDINEGWKYQVKGYDVNAGGLDAVLYKNVARRGATDYRISEDGKPVYFNRVVLWFNNTDGVNNSYIQFIQESAGPAIFAQAVQNGDKKNHIRYDWYLNKAQNETGSDAKVVSYEIIRYRIVDGKPQFTGYPQGQKVDISDKNLTVGMLYEEEASKHLDVTRFLDKGILDDNGFAPGLYEYEIYVTDEHGGRKRAVSNRVAIYEDEIVTPNIVPMQLVELREEYTDKFGTRHDSAAKVLKDAGVAESIVNGKKYMTYRVNDNDKFYIMENIVDSNNKNVPVGVEIIDSKIALDFLNNNPDKYWWTSDYYVRCLDYNRYAGILQGYIDNSMITDKSIPEPTLEIEEVIKSDAGETIKTIAHGTASKFEFGGQTYYSAIVKRGGNLADAIFNVTLKYTYHPADGGEASPETHSAAGIDPVTPRPFWPLYRYVYDRPSRELGAEYKWGKIKVPVNNWNGHSSTGDAILAGDTASVYVRLDQRFDPRNFTLQVDFYRPNVNKDIYNYYDIKYYVDMTNTDTQIDEKIQVPLKVEAVLHDEDREDNHNLTPNRYRMEFKGMHPRNDVYPTVDFVKTEYVPNNQAGTQYKPQTGNFGKMLTIKAERTLQATNNKGLTNVHLGKIKREDGKWDWMYKGHEDFQDNDPTLEKTGNEYEDKSAYDPESEYFTPIKPVYYLIELKNGMGDLTTYPYLVPHVEGHHKETEINTDKNDLITNDEDPLIGTYIAQDFENEATPTVYATAIYIFERPINGTSTGSFTNFNRLEVESLKVNGNETVKPEAANAPAARVRDVSDKELAANGAGDMPNVWEVPAATDVLDMSAANGTTGYNGYIAVKGATYTDTPDSTVTGVEDVLADMENGDAVYYNLQGVRIDKPTATGVYLRVQGNRTTKFVVK